MRATLAERQFGDLVQVPSLPQVANRLSALIHDPEVGLGQIGALIAEDPAISEAVLELANSATYGLSVHITSPEHAATILGVRALRNLTLQAAISAQYAHLERLNGFDARSWWRHAGLTAHIAKLLVKKCRGFSELDPEQLYTCGLLHDIGELVLLDNRGADYARTLSEARANGSPSHRLEAERHGVTHMDVAETVVTRWNLSPRIGEAIRFHHGPFSRIETDPAAAVVAYADQIAHRVADRDTSKPVTAMHRLMAGQFGLQSRALREIAGFASNWVAMAIYPEQD